MEPESGYSTLQQPGTGYNTLGTASGTNYEPLQSPGMTYARLTSGSGSGGTGAVQGTTKTYILPDAETHWSSNKARFPYVSILPLYEKGSLSYNQIQQQNIANCYLAATLASMANTKVGCKVINKMITPHKGTITTICKKFDNDKPPGPVLQLTSDRWFTVSFRNKTVDVSDVLYHDDSDHNPNLQYLTTPNGDRALWGSIIEVAYAKLKGSYDNISAANGLTLNGFLSEFCNLNWDILYPVKDKTKIMMACMGAGTKATYIATVTNAKKLIHWHGYPVIGMSGTKVKLWEPLWAKVETIEFKDLLPEVQAVVTLI